MRRGWIAVSLLAFGCFEFAGDRGEIGFTSNLRVDGEPWTAEGPVANDTRATFVATERLVDEAEDFDVVGHATRALTTIAADGSSITVTGADERGTVWFDGDAEDEFQVRFAAPAEVRWRPLAAGQAGEVRILAGTTVPVAAALRDRKGRPLAYAVDDAGMDLELTADGDGAVWVDQGMVMIQAGDLGPMAIDATLHGEDLPTAAVTVVAADEVVGVDLVPLHSHDPGECGVRAVGRTADGAEVLGAARVAGVQTSPGFEDLASWSCLGPKPDVRAEPR
jgi:hypothetical protein